MAEKNHKYTSFFVQDDNSSSIDAAMCNSSEASSEATQEVLNSPVIQPKEPSFDDLLEEIRQRAIETATDGEESAQEGQEFVVVEVESVVFIDEIKETLSYNFRGQEEVIRTRADRTARDGEGSASESQEAVVVSEEEAPEAPVEEASSYNLRYRKQLQSPKDSKQSELLPKMEAIKCPNSIILDCCAYETDKSCPSCGKNFKSEAKFLFHHPCCTEQAIESAIPDQKPSFRCKVCKRLFKIYQTMSVHMKTHTKEFACPGCGKRFSFKSYLIDHLTKPA